MVVGVQGERSLAAAKTQSFPEMRKPFDLVAEGLLVSSSRGNRTRLELFAMLARAVPTELVCYELSS